MSWITLRFMFSFISSHSVQTDWGNRSEFPSRRSQMTRAGVEMLGFCRTGFCTAPTASWQRNDKQPADVTESWTRLQSCECERMLTHSESADAIITGDKASGSHSTHRDRSIFRASLGPSRRGRCRAAHSPGRRWDGSGWAPAPVTTSWGTETRTWAPQTHWSLKE